MKEISSLTAHSPLASLMFPLAKALLLAFILALTGQNLLAGLSIPEALLTALSYLELTLGLSPELSLELSLETGQESVS